MVFLYIFAGFIVLLMIIAGLMAKTYTVEKTMIIKKPVADVMGRVSNFNDYATWNPWQQMEPDSIKTITGVPGNAGHKYEWRGKKIGMGSLLIKSIDQKNIYIEMQLLKPWKSLAKDNWLFEPWGDGGETKVTWQNSGDLPWPIARLMGPMINKNLNHQFVQGLDNLKKMCEG